MIVLGVGPRAEAIASLNIPGWDIIEFIDRVSYWKIGGAFLDVNAPECVEYFREANLDLVIAANWPLKIRRPLLAVPLYGFWNCHGGPVPEYRGGSPLNWQIIDGKTTLGVTLMQMDEGWDTGPAIDERWFDLGPDETIKDAHKRANAAFVDMVANALTSFPPPTFPQRETLWETRRQRTDEDGMIDWSWDAERIHNFVRALTHPYPGAWFADSNGKKVRVWSTSLESDALSISSTKSEPLPASATANSSLSTARTR